MPGFDGLVQPVRKFALTGERAVPFTGVVSDAADMPKRQLQFEQFERRIRPSAGIYQLFEVQSPFLLCLHQKAPSAEVEDFCHQFDRHVFSGAELSAEC